MTRATWLADTLRDAGLPVVEHAGWKTRGRTFADLRAVVLHHDASPKGDSPGVPAYMLREMAAGRAGAQLWVDRRGVWHVLASGVAYHAGRVLPGMPGNDHSLGVEIDHTTNEAWPQAQLDSVRRGSAAILRRLGQTATALHMHKTICSPKGRKTDPDGLELPSERVRVAAVLATFSAKTTAPPPAPAPPPVIDKKTHKEIDMFIVLDGDDVTQYVCDATSARHITLGERAVYLAAGVPFIGKDEASKEHRAELVNALLSGQAAR